MPNPWTPSETSGKALETTPSQVSAMNAAQSAVTIVAWPHPVTGKWYIPADHLLYTNPGGNLVVIKALLEACLPILDNPFAPSDDE